MQAPPSDHRYRRRFLVEFTPAESDRLDRLGFAHGTKRKAILAGLQLLESGEIEALRGQVAELTAERDAATAAAAQATAAQAVANKEQRAKASATSTKLTEERATHRATKAQLAQARQQLKEARRDLTTAQDEQRRLAARVPHHAFCPACEKYVPEAEWAEEPDPKGGVHVYHKPHGFVPKKTWTQSPSVLFWRSTPSAPKPTS